MEGEGFGGQSCPWLVLAAEPEQPMKLSWALFQSVKLGRAAYALGRKRAGGPARCGWGHGKDADGLQCILEVAPGMWPDAFPAGLAECQALRVGCPAGWGWSLGGAQLEGPPSVAHEDRRSRGAGRWHKPSAQLGCVQFCALGSRSSDCLTAGATCVGLWGPRPSLLSVARSPLGPELLGAFSEACLPWPPREDLHPECGLPPPWPAASH